MKSLPPDNFRNLTRYLYLAPSECQEKNPEKNPEMSEARKLSGIVAHNLSGLDWSLLEVTDETDRDATGDPEDAI